MKGLIKSSVLTFMLLTVALGPDVADAGGTVKGKVTFTGVPPPNEKFVFASFPNARYCAKHPSTSDEGRRRVVVPVETTNNDGLQHAVVSIQDIQDEEWMKKYDGPTIDINLCDFLPRTNIMVNGKNIRVVNHDADPDDPKAEKGILHTVRAYEVLKPRSRSLFSVGLPVKGSALNKPVKLKMWKKGSVIRLTCDQHEWMRSWLLPIHNPYYDIVDDNGFFELSNVPSGNHKLSAWHPVTGKLEKNIEVTEGETVEVNFELAKK